MTAGGAQHRYRIPLMYVKNGVLELTNPGLAIMYGVPIDDFHNVFGDITHANDLPIELKHVGRQRASEAKAHVGSENPIGTIAYWAVQRWGGERVDFEVDSDQETGAVWLLTNDPDVARQAAGPGNGGL